MGGLVNWRTLEGNAIWARHDGDLDSAVEFMEGAIENARENSVSQEEIASMLNYLADLHLLNVDLESVEKVIREALVCSDELEILQIGDNLLILSDVLVAKGQIEAPLNVAERSFSSYSNFGHQHGMDQAQERIESIRKQSAS